MSDGAAALDAQIARLRRLPTLVQSAAPGVARALELELQKQIAAGEGPGGAAWRPRADGSKPLQNAAKALTVTAVSTVVIARITGVEARHHLGAVRGKVKRQILPTAGLPQPMARAIETVVTREFTKIMHGAGK